MSLLRRTVRPAHTDAVSGTPPEDPIPPESLTMAPDPLYSELASQLIVGDTPTGADIPRRADTDAITTARWLEMRSRRPEFDPARNFDPEQRASDDNPAVKNWFRSVFSKVGQRHHGSVSQSPGSRGGAGHAINRRWLAVVPPSGTTEDNGTPSALSRLDNLREMALQVFAEAIELTTSPDPLVAREAELLVNELLDIVLRPVDSGPEENPEPRHRPNRVELYEQRLHTLRASCVRVAATSARRVRETWSMLGLVVTVTAAWLLIQGHPGFALIAFVGRMTVSAILPPPYSIGDRYPQRARLSFRACVAGHISDSIALLGVALSLMVAQRTAYAAAVSVVTIGAIGATVFRLGALQEGVYVRRLSTERLMRNGSLLIGVTMAASFQPHIPQNGFPVLALCSLGPAVYAVFEGLRVERKARRSEARRVGLDSSRRRADKFIQVRVALEEADEIDLRHVS
jgi:hypothetical protein